jgi:hypothetical protein
MIDDYEFPNEQVIERCELALTKLRDENTEYAEFINERIELSQRVMPFMNATNMSITNKSITNEHLISHEMQIALREYIDMLLTGQNMEELAACYMQGFGDALRIVINTGAVPEKK